MLEILKKIFFALLPFLQKAAEDALNDATASKGGSESSQKSESRKDESRQREARTSVPPALRRLSRAPRSLPRQSPRHLSLPNRLRPSHPTVRITRAITAT